MLRWASEQLLELKPEEIGEHYGRYRLHVPEAERIMAKSLERYGQAHQALMVGHLSPYDLAYQQRLGLLQQVFGAHFSPVDALARAWASTYEVLLQQANLWAFVDLFYVIAWGCALCALGVLLFQNVKATRPIAVH